MRKLALVPSVTAWVNGCRVTAGAEVTIRIAELLTLVPAGFKTTIRKDEPLSVEVTGGVVYDKLFAPGISTPFFCHW